MSKLPPDQKAFARAGFIRAIPRLASEVAHLCSAEQVDGFIISLDQSKAYDRVDQHWLTGMLDAMGINPELVSLIRDITYKCRSRVRINGGYSRPFTLARGVRQGDPLSCLLYDFAIEPLGMRLRRSISGLSILSLPPVKLTMYADDTNLFVSAHED